MPTNVVLPAKRKYSYLTFHKNILSNLDKKQTLKKNYKSYYNKRNDRKKMIFLLELKEKGLMVINLPMMQ